jgi:hypothetical protein
VATWDDLRRLALSLPATTESTSAAGDRQWRVRSKLCLWKRPLRPADLRVLGVSALYGWGQQARALLDGVALAWDEVPKAVPDEGYVPFSAVTPRYPRS